MSTTEHEPELNALDQAKHDYENQTGNAVNALAVAENYELRLSERDLSVKAAQAHATLALAAATRMQAETALTSLKRAEQLTRQLEDQLNPRMLVGLETDVDAEAAASVARWNARHDLGLARTVVSAEGRPEDDGLPVFGMHVTALTMREERLVNEAFVAGRDGFAKVMADRAEATPADAGEGL